MINPVLKKELKTKGRTWKTPILISLYTLIVAGFMVLFFLESYYGYRGHLGFNPEVIKTVYFGIAIIQLVLIGFIVPTTTAGSISGEKQRRTFDLLVCTRMSSLSIVLGKLSAALAQIFLLLMVSIPIVSILFLFGGISPGNIIALYGFYIVTAIFFGSIGIFTSALFKRNITATVVSYLIIFLFTGGTIFFLIIIDGLFRVKIGVNSNNYLHTLLYTNPFTGLSAILSQQSGGNFFVSELFRANANYNILYTLYFNLGFDLVFSALLLYLTSLRINPMKKMRSKSRKNKRMKTNAK